jgi:nucleotide-binding universal stress UspA family protein
VKYALELAQSEHAEVILYHVVEITDDWPRDDFDPVRGMVEDRTHMLQRFVRENLSGVDARLQLRQIVEIGLPYRAIVQKAEEEHVDIIIMSTHGRSGFDHMMIGSVTEKVVRRANCPVLSIRPAGSHKPDQPAGL